LPVPRARKHAASADAIRPCIASDIGTRGGCEPGDGADFDRSPGLAVEPTKPTLVAGAYVWHCPLAALSEATIAITKKGQMSLSNGPRRLSALKLDDDFYAPETEVTCAKGFVTVHREKDGRYREASFTWDKKRLVKTARAEGLIPPVRGP
jgi:hypothetical protein